MNETTQLSNYDMKSVWMIYQARRSQYAPGGYEFGFPVRHAAFLSRESAIASIRADWQKFAANGTALEDNLDSASAISFKMLDSVWIEYPMEIAIADSEEVWKEAAPKKFRIKKPTFA